MEKNFAVSHQDKESEISLKRKSREIIEHGQVKREFFSVKRESIFPSAIMGTRSKGPNQVTTATLLEGALKSFGFNDLPELIEYIANENFEEDSTRSKEEQVKDITHDKKYLRCRALLMEILHTILDFCSPNNIATNMVELVTLRGRYMNLEQVAGGSNVNAIIGFATKEIVKNSSKGTFTVLRDETITSEDLQDFLTQRTDRPVDSAFYKIVIPLKSVSKSKFPIDWTPPACIVERSSEKIKQPEKCPVLYVAVTSKKGLCNYQSKIDEKTEKEKTYAFLESYLVAQFETKKVEQDPRHTIRKRL